MRKYAMYMHGGSENHGCEAIVRSTVSILKQSNMVLYSRTPKTDEKYGLSSICTIKQRGMKLKRASMNYFRYQFKRLFLKDPYALIRHNYQNIIQDAHKGDVYFSIGGDNYCGALIPALQYVNRELTKKGALTVLWGCSIDPSYMDKPENVEDLKRYSRIFAREKITFDALVNAGFSEIARHCPDPAFTLVPEEWKLPDLFQKLKIVGVNISPYVQKNGSSNTVYKNYEKLIEHILQNTNYGIALIPHVIWSESNDLIPINALYEKFKTTGRIMRIEDHNCCQLKYCISKCELLVTARTHASIAAYSTAVPTLVIGYSMKSTGLAKDLFGSVEHYVIQAKDMICDDALVNKFVWLDEHNAETKHTLQEIMPSYINKSASAGNDIQMLLQEQDGI